MTTPSPTHKHEASILSDEIVEKAARAILNRPCATISGDYMLGRAKLEARAALEAVLPDLIEECAKVAEKCPLQRSANAWRFSIAARIRSLIPKDSSNG